MKKREILSLICLGVAVGMLLPADVCAKLSNDFGAEKIRSLASQFQNFIFHGALPAVAGVLAGFRAFKSLVSNDYTSLAIYGSGAVGCLALPFFIEGVYGSSMLLP